MKKALLLMSAAMVATGVSAQVAMKQTHVKAETMQMTASPVSMKAVKAVQAQGHNQVVAPKAAEELKVNYILDPATLYIGMTEEQRGYVNALGRYPILTDITWKSDVTPREASLQWTYVNNEVTNWITSTDTVITANYPFTSLDAPQLKATYNGVSDTVNVSTDSRVPVAYLYGGKSTVDGTTLVFSTTYPYSTYRDAQGYGYSQSNAMAFDKSRSALQQGYVDGTSPEWEEVYGEEGYSDIKLDGFAQVLPKPLAPYTISKAAIWAHVTVSSPVTLTMKLYPIIDNKVSDVAIATGTLDLNEGFDKLVVIPLVSVDEDGYETEDPVLIEEETMMVIDGFQEMEGLTTYSPVFGTGSHFKRNMGTGRFEVPSYYHRHAYAYIKYNDELGNATASYVGSPWVFTSASSTSDPNAEWCGAYDWVWQVDATMGWLYVQGENVNDKEYAIAAEDGGSEKTVTLETYFSVLDANVTVLDDADWVVAELGGYDAENGLQNLTLLVDPLEDGQTGRTATVKVSVEGAAPLYIKVNQGDVQGAVETVGTDAAVVASKYFDLQGRELKNVPENGLFIRQDVKANGTTEAVKVIR